MRTKVIQNLGRIFFLTLFFAESTFASHVKVSDSNGTGTNTATVAGALTLKTDSNNLENTDDISAWSIDWSAAQTNSNSSSVNEVTRTFETSLSYSNDEFLNISAGGIYEKSQLGEVQGFGPLLSISRAWKYGHLFVHEEPRKVPGDQEQIKSESEAKNDGTIEVEEFKSSLGFSVTGKKKDYSQKGPKANQVEFQISQSFLELALNWDPVSWLGVSTLYGKYDYNKDVIAFYNLMNRPAVTTARGADLVNGFSSSLQGFTDYEYGLTLTYRISESSNFDLGFTKSLALINHVWSTDTDVSFNSDFAENFGYSIGGSQSVPADTSETNYSANASLSYYF